MISFKFFRGKVYTDEYTLPIPRRVSGRTIAQDLINTVSQTVRDPNYVPASYIPIPERNYDAKVIQIVRTRMRERISWRGYETNVCEPDGYPLLKILGGVNIGGMFHINYSITRNDNTERHRVSIPLVNLQRRG
jgi:phage-related protein